MNNKKTFYSTLLQAKNAARALGFTSLTQYEKGYKQDPHLPAHPNKIYADDWKGWRDFLGAQPRREDFYPTFAQAKNAARALGFTSLSQYQKGYKQDPHLPARPDKTYADDWKGWHDFLGTQPRRGGIYPTFAQAKNAARALGFTSQCQYQKGYKQDPRLPASPNKIYADDWKGWHDFLGTQPRRGNFYPTFDQAKNAARALGFTSQYQYQYQKGYKQDPHLPAYPNKIYADDWKGWHDFLGAQPRRRNFYPTFAQAKNAARALGFTSLTQYEKGYKQDPHLPAHPNKIYADDWKGWRDFLGAQPRREDFYPTFAQAKNAARALGFTSLSQYEKGYKQDPHLPAYPNKIYADDWKGWHDFLGTQPRRGGFYPTFAQAKNAARALGFTSQYQYQKGYKQDPRLPASPNQIYAEDWNGWPNFLLPAEYNSLSDIRHAVKVLNIKNSWEYRQLYKQYPPLPAHPERVFCEQWVDWYDFCDIPRPYSYQYTRKLVSKAGIKSQAEYRKFVTESEDPRLPRTPDKVFKNDWLNWHVFLGKEEPFQTIYIREPYLAWRDAINEFMKTARGGDTKQANLCRFVRLYIQASDLGYSPQEFLTRGNSDIRPFRTLLEQQKSDNTRRGLLVAVNEFLEYILRTKLTLEDEDTGELIVASNAHNPFARLSVDNQYSSFHRGESSKPALAYQYVQAARDWMVPENAKAFGDLKHLQSFDADWVEVDSSIVDKSDPDCVYREEAGKTKLWFPAYWMHTFALISIPARGRQIAYNDSGEGDKWLPNYEKVDVLANNKRGKLIWEENSGPLAGSTDNQGFIKRCDEGQPGMHFTTNKTSYHGKGYGVPWIPLELVYWLIRLRKWQAKYNPINQPTAWLDCQRTSLNETQRKAKGGNCFLFRDFGKTEPGYFSGRLANRLAATLYNSQPKDIELAVLEGHANSLSHYKSKYTPHSMRVSLITAYVVEFGLPLHVIVKVAGHSSIIMSLYYTKANAEGLRNRFNEGEKRALKSKSHSAQRMIEQGRIDEIKHELTGNSDEALSVISGLTPIGNFLFRDYGICPFAGSRCDDGGPQAGKNQVRFPVPSGYLGCQNCIRCRHFITGPAFIGGLLSLSNEISLHAQSQFEQYDELEEKSAEFKHRIDKLDNAAYDAEQRGQSFDDGELNQLRVEQRKIRSESESAAKKLDVFMCDIQATARLIKQCKALINQQAADQTENDSTQLIVQPDHELELAVEEVSKFRQFAEVCENKEIYESANADLAIAPRSQMLDRMALLNHFSLDLFTLSKKQQLVIGNQITKLMLDRLKTWERVDALVDGKIYLQDLQADERLTQREIQAITRPKLKAIKGGRG